MAKKKTRRGRPAASRNQDYDQAEAVQSSCRRCGSTERAPYWGKIITPYKGYHCDSCHQVAPGQRACPCGGMINIAITATVTRRTRCLSCGQHRVDRSLENRTIKKHGGATHGGATDRS